MICGFFRWDFDRLACKDDHTIRRHGPVFGGHDETAFVKLVVGAEWCRCRKRLWRCILDEQAREWRGHGVFGRDAVIDRGDDNIITFLGRLIRRAARRRIRSGHRSSRSCSNRVDRRRRIAGSVRISRGEFGPAVAQIDRGESGDRGRAGFGCLCATLGQAGSRIGQCKFNAGWLITGSASDVVAGDQHVIGTPDATRDQQQGSDSRCERHDRDAAAFVGFTSAKNSHLFSFGQLTAGKPGSQDAAPLLFFNWYIRRQAGGRRRGAMTVLGRNTLCALGSSMLPGINAIGAVWLGMSLRAARATWGHPAGIALTGLRTLKLGAAILRLLRPLTRYEFCGGSRRRRALRSRAAGGRASRCTTMRSAGGAASLAKSRRRAGIRLIDRGVRGRL